MSYRPSVYQTDPALAASVNNLSGALFGDPAKEAAYASSLGEQYVNAEKVTSSRRNRRSLDRVGHSIRNGNLSDAIGYVAETGDAALLGQMPGANLAWGAADEGTSDDRLQRLRFGTGKVMGPTDAITMDQSEARLSSAFDRAMAAEGARGDTARANNGPMSTDQFYAQQFNSGTPLTEQQELVAVGRPGGRAPAPFELDADTLQTADVYLDSMYEDAPLKGPVKAQVMERFGEYMGNPQSPAYRNMASAMGMAQRDVLGDEETVEGKYNPFKANRTGQGEGYATPSPSWTQGLTPGATGNQDAGGASQPVRVNSPQEAMALPAGTRFVTPDGRVKVAPGPGGPQ